MPDHHDGLPSVDRLTYVLSRDLQDDDLGLWEVVWTLNRLAPAAPLSAKIALARRAVQELSDEYDLWRGDWPGGPVALLRAEDERTLARDDAPWHDPETATLLVWIRGRAASRAHFSQHDQAHGGREFRFDGSVTTNDEPALSVGELALLRDAQADDVSFVWVLIDLGLRGDPPSTPDWRPGRQEMDAAFEVLERLSRLRLIEVGRVEYVDGGPPGRVAPVRHIAEPVAVVRPGVG